MARGEHDYRTECLQQFKQVAIATHLSLESRPRQLAPSPRAEHSVRAMAGGVLCRALWHVQSDRERG